MINFYKRVRKKFSHPILCIIFQEKYFSCYVLLTDQIPLSDAFTLWDMWQYVYCNPNLGGFLGVRFEVVGGGVKFFSPLPLPPNFFDSVLFLLSSLVTGPCFMSISSPLHVFFETFQSGLKYRKTRLHDFDIRLDLEIIHAPNGYSFSSESIMNKNYDAFVTKQPFNFLWIQNRKIWFSALIFYPKTIEINKSFSSLTQTKFRLANLNFIFWKDEF